MNAQAQTWLITGASSGFGRAFAEHALAQGHNVVATARDAARLAGLAALAPDRVLALSVDVDRAGDAQRAVDAAVERFGSLDVLINNAGYGLVGAVEETPENEWRAVMETNFFGALAMTRAALPRMRAQKRGAIVNVSSMGGQLSYAGYGAYSATKFALEGMSEALALEVAPFAIKVMIVEPGAFRTDFAGNALRHMPEMDEYRETSGVVREFSRGMHETQAGDPAKAAVAVAAALQADKTPLRLQLGADAVDAVRGHAEQLLSDLRAWEGVALDTRIDA
ncbi:SDR family NAD(P)-dependent oxidoreductase [Luteimonas gilva]|uniref:SDR family NAD(P)-dependent oxidoreductase n=1 Tax=Luteimonas gilva TaxID=2572684 RepID=A0A4U5JL15_9GAMM|nr:oxidoreductase [Luteimonas gilva]TKR30310.1 SDR family NAD(P)-dependent oxidoreductase [Luteimonas gilva]